ncbi:Protein C06A1.2 b [Aphelenchoides avenae]|nr:Protein C06A1.2 b [Aphelenchus avenae]
MTAATQDSGAVEICPGRFAFECSEVNCCHSYHMRFIMLLFSAGILLLALIVFAVWVGYAFRPSNRHMILSRTRNRREERALSEVEIRSDEETKYLRRMSELK